MGGLMTENPVVNCVCMFWPYPGGGQVSSQTWHLAFSSSPSWLLSMEVWNQSEWLKDFH